MKTAISIPDGVFQSAERLAARLGVSRSELYSRALASLVDKHRDDSTTSRLNEVYGPELEASSLDAGFALLQHQSLFRDKPRGKP